MIPNATYQAMIDSGNAQFFATRDSSTGLLAQISASIYTETAEQARELAARFPKSAGVRANYLSGCEYDVDLVTFRGPVPADKRHPWQCGLVTWRVYLSEDGVNKGRNETGLKRYRTLRKHLGRLGITAEWDVRNVHTLNRVDGFDHLAALIADYEAGR
jgi:hypothetical protein